MNRTASFESFLAHVGGATGSLRSAVELVAIDPATGRLLLDDWVDREYAWLDSNSPEACYSATYAQYASAVASLGLAADGLAGGDISGADVRLNQAAVSLAQVAYGLEAGC